MADFGLFVSTLGLFMVAITFFNHDVQAQANSTCYHCYWFDSYNGGNDNELLLSFYGSEFDNRSAEGVYTPNCKTNLDLVPTIQCAGDCGTHEFLSHPAYHSKGGFVNYISRTCYGGEQPFVERDSCIEGTKRLSNPSDRLTVEATLCRCSEDQCNNKPIRELNLTTCYNCHYGTHNESSDPVLSDVFFQNLPGQWTSRCEAPDSSLMSTAECPFDCSYFSETVEAFADINGTLNIMGRYCWFESQQLRDSYGGQLVNPGTCVDILNSRANETLWREPEFKWLDNTRCRCSGDLCGGLGTAGADEISMSFGLLILPTVTFILNLYGLRGHQG